MKQVHCCIWNYVRKEWYFAVDEVRGNLQGSFTDVQVNSFGIYLSGRSVFKPIHHATVLPYNRTRASSPCLYDLKKKKNLLFFFSSFLRVWLLGKHIRMVSEQRRFFQLLHWKAFSYRERAICSVVASHCMTKHDLMMFSQMSLLPGLQTLYRSRTIFFCSAQAEREIIETPVSSCFIQRERWLFVSPV